MRLLCITDLHNNTSMLKRILKTESDFDVLILGGDLTHFGTPADVSIVVHTAESARVPILAVAGNCDSADIDRWLDDHGIGLHAHGRIVDGVSFFGLSAMPPWTGRMYEFAETELDGFLAAGHAEVDGGSPLVLISHAPPRDAVDRTADGRHVGSTAVKEWVEKVNPDLVVCGHIHEARGIANVGDTLVVNCGKAIAGEYAVVDVTPEVSAELRQIPVS